MSHRYPQENWGDGNSIVGNHIEGEARDILEEKSLERSFVRLTKERDSYKYKFRNAYFSGWGCDNFDLSPMPIRGIGTLYLNARNEPIEAEFFDIRRDGIMRTNKYEIKLKIEDDKAVCYLRENAK